MHALPFRFVLVAVVLLLPFSPVVAQPACPQSWAVCLTEAASNWVNTLTPEQQTVALRSFDDETRVHWSNLPFGQTDRIGVKLDEMKLEQQKALHLLLQTALSPAGYLQAMFILQADDVTRMVLLDNGVHDERQYGSAYFFSVLYGDPRSDKNWSWRFEGHHLSLNFTILDGEVHVSPFFAGINPEVQTKGNFGGMEIMAPETHNAFALWNSLTPDQRKIARIQQEVLLDVRTQKGDEPFLEAPEGLHLQRLNEVQGHYAQAILGAFVNKLPAEKAHELISAYSIEEYYFAWAGGEKPDDLIYFRLQGPEVVIEYSNRDGSPHHIHSVWWVLDEAMH